MQQNKFVHAFFGGPIGLPTYVNTSEDAIHVNTEVNMEVNTGRQRATGGDDKV